jgi:hypothetical protein
MLLFVVVVVVSGLIVDYGGVGPVRRCERIFAVPVRPLHASRAGPLLEPSVSS